MRIATGSDEKTHLTDTVLAELERRGVEVELYGEGEDAECVADVAAIEESYTVSQAGR